MTTPIYLDYNATTPIDPAVVDAMEPYLRGQFGNPSSDHAYGYRTRAAVQTAREQLAALLGAAPEEVVFTGSGSEANNLAIKGVAYALRARGNHLITSAVEHPAVVGPLRFLERQGYQVTTLPVDADGRVDPAQVAAAITDQTILVSIMHANSVVGLGRAAALALERLPEYQERVRALRDTLYRRILERVPTAVLNGHPVERLPNTLNLSFPGVNAAALLAAIRDQVACSTGSACHAGHASPSQVLLAMGRDAGLAAAALRLSLGWTTTAQEIQQAADVIDAAVSARTGL